MRSAFKKEGFYMMYTCFLVNLFRVMNLYFCFSFSCFNIHKYSYYDYKRLKIVCRAFVKVD